MKSDTRTEILQQALSLFAKKGYQSVGMRDIASAVGIKAPSIYKHFANKEAILEELLETYGPNRITDTLAEIDHLDDPDDAIRHLLSVLLEMFGDKSDNDVMRILIGESMRDPKIADRVNDVLFTKQRDAIIKFIEMLIEAKKITPVEPSTVADIIISVALFNRYKILLSGNDTKRRKEIESSLLNQVLLMWQRIQD